MLSILILLFWGYFIVAHLTGEEGRASRPLGASDYISLATMAAWLVGLAIAWKWELAGGVLALVAVSIGAVVNWRVLVFPGSLIALAAVLFLLSWWMNKSLGKHSAAPTA